DVRLHNCRVSYNSQFCRGIEKKILHNFLKEDMWHEQLSWVQAWLVWQPLGICKNVAMTSKLLTARASQLVRHGAMQVGYLHRRAFRSLSAYCGCRLRLCCSPQILHYRCYLRLMSACGHSWRSLWRMPRNPPGI